MKQNIFGAILFSIIVGTAIFVSEFFAVTPTPLVVQLPDNPVYESRNSCSKRSYRVVSNIRVTQAVLNPRTNQLNASLEIERQLRGNGHFGVTFHFFVKEGAETRHLASETFGVQPNFSEGNMATHEIVSSYAWLDALSAKNNLYLIASLNDNPFSKTYSIPRFDESIAVPILSMKGKN